LKDAESVLGVRDKDLLICVAEVGSLRLDCCCAENLFVESEVQVRFVQAFLVMIDALINSTQDILLAFSLLTLVIHSR
jgi:hypothetical protein